MSNEASPYEEPVPSTTETKPFYMNPIHSSNRQLYEASTTSVPHYEFDSQQNGNAVCQHIPNSLLYPYQLL